MREQGNEVVAPEGRDYEFALGIECLEDDHRGDDIGIVDEGHLNPLSFDEDLARDVGLRGEDEAEVGVFGDGGYVPVGLFPIVLVVFGAESIEVVGEDAILAG